MANLNRIVLVGRLTADPEMRYIVDGTAITKFRLAVDRDRKTDDTHQVDFIPIIAWRKLAEICGQYLKKGRLVLVEGRIQIRSYDTQAGVRRWTTEVVARNMQMLGRPANPQLQAVNEASEEASTVNSTEPLSRAAEVQVASEEIIEDEIPVPAMVPDDEELPF